MSDDGGRPDIDVTVRSLAAGAVPRRRLPEVRRVPEATRVDRRTFLRESALVGGLVAVTPAAAHAGGCPPGSDACDTSRPGAVPAFEFDEATLGGLRARLDAGTLSAEALTAAYLARIEALDRQGPELGAVIEVNPDALKIAAGLDAERRERGSRGPLHGIPVLVKDNLDTADRMATTAGSLALVGARVARDAFVVERLRAAGAVLLGKANLSEWANFRSTHSTSGWSGRGGQCRNPYVLDRNPCGSSSGSAVAVAANLCALAVGTETDGSVVCPSTANGVVGLKPTLGLVSRAGIIPIAASQDTAGPMGRTVADVAVLLGALAGEDPRDEATRGQVHADYARFLDAGGLKGARLGVARNLAGFHPAVDRLFEEAVAELQRLGAVLVDPADVPHLREYDDSEFEVLLYEFKAGLNAYLAGLGPEAPVRTLAEAIAFNERERRREMPHFGQELFLKAQEKGGLDAPEYKEALAKNRRLSRAEGLDAVLDSNKIEALVAPTGGPAWLTDYVNGDHYTGGGASTPAAVSGYPHLTVPMGFVSGLPIGLSFIGRAWSEPALLRFGFAFEQATRQRRPPQFLATLPP